MSVAKQTPEVNCFFLWRPQHTDALGPHLPSRLWMRGRFLWSLTLHRGVLRRLLRYLKYIYVFLKSSLINLSFYRGEKCSTLHRGRREALFQCTMGTWECDTGSAPWTPTFPWHPHTSHFFTPSVRGRCRQSDTPARNALGYEKTWPQENPAFHTVHITETQNCVVETSLIH